MFSSYNIEICQQLLFWKEMYKSYRFQILKNSPKIDKIVFLKSKSCMMCVRCLWTYYSWCDIISSYDQEGIWIFIFEKFTKYRQKSYFQKPSRVRCVSGVFEHITAGVTSSGHMTRKLYRFVYLKNSPKINKIIFPKTKSCKMCVRCVWTYYSWCDIIGSHDQEVI